MEFNVDWTNQLCIGRRGVVVAELPKAAMEGLGILQEGGNAVDAAVTMATVLNVVGPGYSGLGGDAFILVWDAQTKKVTAINGSGAVPLDASVEYYRKQGLEAMPVDGIHSVSVPGAVDAYCTVLERFGTMPLERLLAPAIAYAEEGYELPLAHARYLMEHEKLNKFPSSAAIFCRDLQVSGHLGRLVNKDLGCTLRRIAEGGRQAFYEGEIAAQIVACSQAEGGLFRMEDFARHQTQVYDPIAVDYRGHTVYQTALPSQGHIVLEMLNILEGYELEAMGFGSLDHVHCMVEAKKRAFTDRLAFSGDPHFVDVPMDKILSKEFAAQRRASIDMGQASAAVTPGNVHHDGDTTSFAVTDGQGNAVSFIISLSSYLGSGLVAQGTGMLLNDRPGREQGFVFDEGHPDRLEGGKRTVHTLNTYMVCKGDEVFFLGNTPGGDMQPQLNTQSIVNAIDFGMAPQWAVEAPVVMSTPGTCPGEVGDPYVLHLDHRFGEEMKAALEQRGHEVRLARSPGNRKMIMRDPEAGAWMGGSEREALAF
ncbi:MAG: gamma-glutamyltransferase [Candidatus Latescibacteria bacterium]|nr:gamma-glutamyltransferase [Candidatus Latescibacterota bacterium]